MISIRVWCFVVLLSCSEIRARNSVGTRLNLITPDDLSEQNVSGDRVIVVDPNGGGDAKTINAAIAMVPKQNAERVKIKVGPGTYEEKVLIPVSKPYISLIGDPDHPEQTVITGHAKSSDTNEIGIPVGTWNSATVIVASDYFIASGITFQNTGVGAQAVALRASGDKAVFDRVRFIGSQDTLLADEGSHYFRNCFIQGTVDFICGNGRSLFHGCTISVVQPGYAIAAQKRDKADDNTGFSFVDCTITGVGTPYLGRAWGNYSRVVYSMCKFDIDVMPEGWYDWGVEARQKTALFAEYNCTGKGANTTGRVPWAKSLSEEEIKPYLDSTFIDGQHWLKL